MSQIPDIREWRSRHIDPFVKGDKPMRVSSARLVIGLSEEGFRKQQRGERPITCQTANLMMAYDLMTPDQRLDFVEQIKEAAVPLKVTGFSRPGAARRKQPDPRQLDIEDVISAETMAYL